MSNLYNLEPQPTAKVVLQTTSGDLTFELFAKQTPLASRNFLQHCLDGYYNNTIFHRLVPGFIIQGGDPTGTGSGGISALNDGEPFQDEFHSRLKYNRRGLLGMANEGANSNGSQFFITLGVTPELQGRNTLFGRVEGDTIYNLMKMADAELVEGEGSERPLFPTRITGAEILVNPFEDMVANAREADRVKPEERRDKKEVKKRKKPAGKNVLSFGGDAEDDITPIVKRAKVNPKFMVVDTAEESYEHRERKAENVPRIGEPSQEPVVAQDDRHVKSSSVAPSVDRPVKPATGSLVSGRDTVLVNEDDSESDSDGSREGSKAKVSALDRTNAEIAALKESMKRSVDVKHAPQEKPRSALEALIPATSTRGRKRGAKASGNDEQGALDLFKAFKQRLDGLPTASEPQHADGSVAPDGRAKTDALPEGRSKPDVDDEEAVLCDLHFIPNCQSCKSWEADDVANERDEDDDSTAWMSHKLSFAKDTLGKDLEWKRKMQEIEVIDPREKSKEIMGSRKKGKENSRR